jgi:hypothetical protein
MYKWPGVPNLDTGQVQFPKQEHLLPYRITVDVSHSTIVKSVVSETISEL